MNATIINRGRGPEIAGTRITVYHILDYVKLDWHHTAIASWLRLSSRQVLAALEYIDAHREEMEIEYQKMLDREKRGNPPEVRAKLKESTAKLHALLAKRQGRVCNSPSLGQPPQEPCAPVRGT